MIPSLARLVIQVEPGGFLQWSEYNFWTTKIASVIKCEGDTAMHRLNQLMLDCGQGR